jgi:hypothetical protein
MESCEVAQRLVRAGQKIDALWQELDLTGMSIEFNKKGFSEVASYGNPGPEEISVAQEAYNMLDLPDLTWSVTFGKDTRQGVLFTHQIITQSGLQGATIFLRLRENGSFVFETLFSPLSKDLNGHQELSWRRQGLATAPIEVLRELEHIKNREDTPLTLVKRAMLLSPNVEVRERKSAGRQALYGVWVCPESFVFGV